jgi:AcrR family transcriptional regulator
MSRTDATHSTPSSPATGIDLTTDDIVVVDADETSAASSERGPIDGRHARSERSRQAMVDAVLDLLREGVMRPSSAQIAERAGVTQRTLFNQFGDMDSLIGAVASRQVQRVFKLLPRAGEGSFEERVASYCDGLERMLEDTMHVRWAVITNPNPAWAGARIVQTAREFMRTQLHDAFAPEFEKIDDAAAAELVDALELETDPAVWRLRRVQQELSPEEARAIVERSILALMRDAIAHPVG